LGSERIEGCLISRVQMEKRGVCGGVGSEDVVQVFSLYYKVTGVGIGFVLWGNDKVMLYEPRLVKGRTIWSSLSPTLPIIGIYDNKT
jgi:hypothetical protein